MVAAILLFLFIVLAAFFKAVADTLADHFDKSVFRYKDPRFWNKEISWQYVGYLKFTKYPPDGWHLANSLQIVSWCAANVCCLFVGWWLCHLLIKVELSWWQIVLAVGAFFFVAGAIFIGVFNLFYNKILKR